MQAALSKLVTENEELRSKSEVILSENQRLDGVISSWIRSSVSLQRFHRATKPSGDKTGLGYTSDKGSTTETSSTPMLERTKFRNFVKSSTGQPKEAQSGDDMIVAKPSI
ncbi:spindle pole body component 110-like [Dorcoceras hygrometricum]|uniref:Spindle pole body component 110-like n=1 Tax=Dorcoceras hygrometricum TaxID=472368 RepID=A0A2Z7BUP2_9LAMI|nr:spindle pole body component 110-like [Dorcoceras hygrometricum]